MAGGLTAAALVGAAASAYSAKKQGDAAERAAKAASQPQITTSEPWAPSAQYRQDLMNLAMSYLPGGGGNTAYGSAGGGGKQVDLATFTKVINADPSLTADGKAWLLSMAKGGGMTDAYAALQKMPRASAQTLQALGLSGAQAQAPRAGGGGGGGGRSGGGGGGSSMSGYYNSKIKEILDGQYLSGNPYLDAAIAKATRGMDDRYASNYGNIDLSAELTGRLGGGAHQLERARAFSDYNTAVGDIDAGMRFQDYDAERNRMMQALGIGTGYDAQLQSVAAQRAATAAAARTAAASLAQRRNEFNTMLPYQQMGSVADIINAMSGAYGTRTGQQTVAPAYTQDPFSAGLQGGLAGYSIAKNWGRTGSQAPPSQPAPTGQVGGYFTGYTQPNWVIG